LLYFKVYSVEDPRKSALTIKNVGFEGLETTNPQQGGFWFLSKWSCCGADAACFRIDLKTSVRLGN
jgi:hypothetical protein